MPRITFVRTHPPAETPLPVIDTTGHLADDPEARALADELAAEGWRLHVAMPTTFYQITLTHAADDRGAFVRASHLAPGIRLAHQRATAPRQEETP